MKIVMLIIFAILSANSFALDKVELYLKWKHQFQFAGYYAAVEKGFFEEEGLNVEIIPRSLDWKVSDKVLEGPGRYGVSDSSIVYEFLQGRDLIILSSIFQRSPLVFATRSEDNLTSPIDLKGKKVMYQKNIDDAAFKIMFQNSGVSEDDIIHVPHSMSNDALINKTVDAISIYTTNQPFYFMQRQVDIHLIEPINYGADLYGDTLITGGDEALNHHERAKAMRRASIKGWYYALENMEEISKLIKQKYNPSLSLDKIIFEANQTKKIISPDLVPIGHTNAGRLNRISSYYTNNSKLDHKNLELLLFDSFLEAKKGKTQSNIIKALIITLLILSVTLIPIIFFNRKLRYEVNKQTSRLDELMREKESFFASMTHELRTPLNGIIGALYFLNETEDEEKRSEYINSISYSSNVLLDLVNDILDFSKFENKKMKLVEENQAIKSILQSSILTLQAMAERKGIHFIVNNQISDSLWVKIDSTKFSQVINNIIGNAIKFTDEGHVKVTFYSKKIDDLIQVHCEVEDSGIGISKEGLKSLFTPFKQVNQKGRAQVKGTGLGLVICKKIVGLMQGDIHIHQNSYHGTTCRFYVTCSEHFRQNDTDNKKTLASVHIPNYENLNVLIAEDNPINRMLLEKFLAKFKIQAVMAENGKEALELLEKSTFDILFLDKQMPIMDGIETCKRIRSHPRNTLSKLYIVGQSADWTGLLDPECKALGMNATLPKPTRYKDIERVLNDFVNSKTSKKAS